MKTPKLIEIKPAEVEALLERVEKEALQEGDYEIIKGLIEAFVYISQSLDERTTVIRRLLRLIFGAKTETRKKLFEIAAKQEEGDDKEESSSSGKKPGHGRNGADAYKKAERIKIPIQDLKAGERCRECSKGKLYPVKKSGTLVRFVGMAPLAAKIYDLEKLRCNLCGEVFTAEPPENVGNEKYDETAGAMIAMLKYGSGMPFHRIEKLQESMGVPLPASTQWDIVENAANKGPHPAYRELVRQAAQGEVIHNDDTPAKILEVIKEISEQSLRKGTFTTGMVSTNGDNKIALFFTGTKHAGENMTELLKHRQTELDPPIQMCDALSRNLPDNLQTILANCLTHGRRNFVEVAHNFPEETAYVIDQIAAVYKTDETAREQNLSPQERLNLHQKESGPVMESLKSWCSAQLEEKKTEPNSSLGKAIAYNKTIVNVGMVVIIYQTTPDSNNPETKRNTILFSLPLVGYFQHLEGDKRLTEKEIDDLFIETATKTVEEHLVKRLKGVRLDKINGTVSSRDGGSVIVNFGTLQGMEKNNKVDFFDYTGKKIGRGTVTELRKEDCTVRLDSEFNISEGCSAIGYICKGMSEDNYQVASFKISSKKAATLFEEKRLGQQVAQWFSDFLVDRSGKAVLPSKLNGEWITEATGESFSVFVKEGQAQRFEIPPAKYPVHLDLTGINCKMMEGNNVNEIWAYKAWLKVDIPDKKFSKKFSEISSKNLVTGVQQYAEKDEFFDLIHQLTAKAAMEETL